MKWFDIVKQTLSRKVRKSLKFIPNYIELFTYKKEIKKNWPIPANRIRFLVEMGYLLIKYNKNIEGLGFLEEAYHRKPKNIVVLQYLARSLIYLGKKDEANKYLQELITIEPNSPLWVYYYANEQGYNVIKMDKQKLVYFPIPKNASTTIKKNIYEYQHSKDIINPHPFFENPSIKINCSNLKELKEYYKFAVIRDPIKRLLSYYNKNIVEAKSLLTRGYKGKRAFGLDLNPSLNEFIEKLEKYQYCFNDVFHHTLLQNAYLKRMDLDFATDISNMNELSEILINKLQAISEFKVVMRSPSRHKTKEVEISDKNFKKLKNIYKEDYELINKYNL